MKYLKKYEEITQKHSNTIYENEDFLIYLNFNNHIVYHSDIPYTEASAIFYMASLIRDKSKYLEDEKLRKLKISIEDKKDKLENLNNSMTIYKQNMINNRTSNLHYFLDRNQNDNIPENIYIELIDLYYPKFIEIIKKIETLGDVIDEFKIIYKDLLSDLDIKMKNYINVNNKKGKYRIVTADSYLFIVEFSPLTRGDEQSSDFKFLYRYEKSKLKDISNISEDDLFDDIPQDFFNKIKVYYFSTLQDAVDNVEIILNQNKYNL